MYAPLHAGLVSMKHIIPVLYMAVRHVRYDAAFGLIITITMPARMEGGFYGLKCNNMHSLTTQLSAAMRRKRRIRQMDRSEDNAFDTDSLGTNDTMLA